MAARSRLATGDVAGALAALEQRPWAPESPLAELEIEALLQVDHEAAAKALGPALEHSEGAARLRRTLWAVRLAKTRGDLAALDAMTTQAIDLARAQKDAAAELTALVSRMRGLNAIASGIALIERLLASDDTTLQRHAGLVAEALMLVGPHSVPALQRAVKLFGNTHDERGMFRFDAFAVRRLLESAANPEAAADLTRLAIELGLPSAGVSAQDVARMAIRYGRLGDALALTHGGHHAAVREGIVALINPNLTIQRDPA